MKAELQQVCGQVLAATANGVYQGILVALLVGWLLRLLARTNAATRHAVWFATLLLLVLAIPAHYWLQRDALPPARWSFLPGNSPDERLAGASVQPTIGFLPGIGGAATGGESAEMALDGPVLPTPTQPQDTPPVAVPLSAQVNPEPIIASLKPMMPRTRWWQVLMDRALHPVCWNLDSAAGLPLLATVLVLWAGLALVRLLALGRRLLQLSDLKAGARAPGPELAALFARLCGEEPSRRTADLRISPQPLGPIVSGFGRPFILLPEDLAAPSNSIQAEHVLRHELAHLRRYDDWANLIQHFVQAILFFHPAVWWIGKELTLQREIACDDWVLQHAGGRRSYALTLTSVAGRIRQPAPLLAPGVSNSKSQLQQRINMILNTRRNSAPGLCKARLVSVLSATSVLGALALCAGPRFGLAQSVRTVSDTTASTASVAVAPAAANDTTSATIAVVQADEPAPPTPAIDAGPKFKPESPDREPAESGEVSAPTPPEAPVAPVPRVARVGKAGKAPRSADSVGDEGDDNSSIEARLRRLEKMVKELMSQQNLKHSRGFVYSKEDGNQNFNLDQQMFDKMKQSAERQAARAAEQAQRFAEQAKRMTKDFEARQGQEDGYKGDAREALQRQLETLRKAREGLGQEIERLDRQIEKLKKQQDRGDKDQRSRSENSGAKLQAQADPAPAAAP